MRVFDWVDRLGLDVRRLEYAGLSNNRPRTLLARPLVTARAELRSRLESRHASHLVLSREASPFSSGGLEARILRSAEHGVYDFDDALFNDPGHGVRALFSKAQKCNSAVRAADHVIAGNEYLAEWAALRNRQVTLIPSCVDVEAYKRKEDWRIGGAPRLVWMGSPSTEKFLLSVAPALLQVHSATGARLLVISGAGKGSLGPLDKIVDRTQWTIDSFTDVIASSDIGISPLADTPYARGKCAYKILQYAASGVPIVGSPVGANNLALRRLHGMSATTIDDWIGALLEMISSSASERMARGVAGRRAVEQHYSFNSWESTWRKVVLGE